MEIIARLISMLLFIGFICLCAILVYYSLFIVFFVVVPVVLTLVIIKAIKENSSR